MDGPISRYQLQNMGDIIRTKKLAELLAKQIALDVIFLAQSENISCQYVKDKWFDYTNQEIFLTNSLKDELLKLLVTKFPGSGIYFIESSNLQPKPRLIIDWSPYKSEKR